MATANSGGNYQYYPVYSDNTSYSNSSTITYTLQGANTSGVIFNGPVQVTPAPPKPRTEIERLLADVESVCSLAR